MVDPFDDVDALLLVGFGGPEQPDEVVPFLANVTAGARIPRERLEEVGEHYFLFGGRSPINDQAKALMAALHEELTRRGHDLPIHWGNKFWHPFISEALDAAEAAGHRRLLVMSISAYPSYSGCRSYREAIAEAAGERDFTFRRIGHYALDEGFLASNSDAVREALTRLDGEARLVFVTHSIPVAMNDTSGPENARGAYLDWHRQVVDEIGRRVGVTDHDLVYCSRSGPPQQAWLEPDVNDHLEALAAQGVQRVVLAPVGFISDHMEVVYDLDTEARATCERLGIAMERADTVGVRAAFVAALADRVERAASTDPLPTGCGGASCCPHPRAMTKPAID